MKKISLMNGLILGGSLIISIGLISIASINASTVGDNSGVFKPINESSNAQTKTGGLTVGRLTATGGIIVKNTSNTNVATINNSGAIRGSSLSIKSGNITDYPTLPNNIVNKKYVDDNKGELEVSPTGFNFVGPGAGILKNRGGTTQVTSYNYPEYICSISGFVPSDEPGKQSACGLYVEDGKWKMRSNNSYYNGCMYMCFKIK